MVRHIYIAFLFMKSERQYRDYMILPLIITKRDFHLVHASTLHKSQTKWLISCYVRAEFLTGLISLPAIRKAF